jgi:hypothetical protein
MPRVISDRERQIVANIMREFAQYQTRRSRFAGQCEEVAELILPTSRNTFFYRTTTGPAQKKTQQQVDATGALALHRFCAIADSLVTPRNMQWHGLQSDDYVMKDRASRLWFEKHDQAAVRMRYAAIANFAAQNYNNWQSLGAFGNSTMYVDKFDGRWHRGVRGCATSRPVRRDLLRREPSGQGRPHDPLVPAHRLSGGAEVGPRALPEPLAPLSRTASGPTTSCIA